VRKNLAECLNEIRKVLEQFFVSFGSRQEALPDFYEQQWALLQFSRVPQVLLKDVKDPHPPVSRDSREADDHGQGTGPPRCR
jgi:hypothetical protein